MKSIKMPMFLALVFICQGLMTAQTTMTVTEKFNCKTEVVSGAGSNLDCTKISEVPPPSTGGGTAVTQNPIICQTKTAGYWQIVTFYADSVALTLIDKKKLPDQTKLYSIPIGNATITGAALIDAASVDRTTWDALPAADKWALAQPDPPTQYPKVMISGACASKILTEMKLTTDAL